MSTITICLEDFATHRVIRNDLLDAQPRQRVLHTVRERASRPIATAEFPYKINVSLEIFAMNGLRTLTNEAMS